MCGIAGLWSESIREAGQLAAIATRMCDAIVHRGPDDSGVFVDANSGAALGHRRLSIVDLSPAGHQPMASRSGRYTLVFNGEIYNFQTLRSELGASVGGSWRGHSDTEVMLAAFEQWGVDGATAHFNGMFAFALWDKVEGALHLSRDRLGEKPLYYGWSGGSLVFGSELKALQQYPGFAPSVSKGALAVFLRLGYVPDPHSIYEDVTKVEPGTIVSFRDRRVVNTRRYWSLANVIDEGARRPFRGTLNDAEEQLDALLQRAVGIRTIADVPLGAFLSGGVDSSLIVALMQRQSSRSVKTFTIGFEEPNYDEAPFARAVATHLGTEHTEVYVSAKEGLATVPELPRLYDEPFADPSQIPTYLVSRVARKHVTVCLSGDAGDELFGGYERYQVARTVSRRLDWAPAPARRALGAAIDALPPAIVNRFGATLAAAKLLPEKYRHVLLGDKLAKLAKVLRFGSTTDLYASLMSHWIPDDIVEWKEVPTALTDSSDWPAVPDLTRRMMQIDMQSYLPGDILVKVDRAAMAVSLETRVPLLDPDVIAFAWTLPHDFLVEDGRGKHVLRRVLERYVPRTLIDRPKRGFGIPLESWLRGPLREWGEALLASDRLKADGLMRVDVIREKWDQHQRGVRNWHFQLWNVLMFQAWLEARAQ